MTGLELPPVAQSRLDRARATLATLAASPGLRVLEISTSALGGVPVAAVVLGPGGERLLDTLIHTDDSIEPGAQAVHGISAGMLVGAPSYAEVQTMLGELLAPGFDVVTWAAPFIQASLNRGARAAGVPLLPSRHWQPGLQGLVSPLAGTYSHRRFDWFDVPRRKALEGVPLPAGAAAEGTALGNAERALAMLRHYARPPRPVDEVAALDEVACPVCRAPESFCECGRVEVGP